MAEDTGAPTVDCKRCGRQSPAATGVFYGGAQFLMLDPEPDG